MKSVVEQIFLKTRRATELIPITGEVRQAVGKSGIRNGLVNIFTQHVTTAVTINENDPKLEADIARFMEKIVPEDESYAHSHFFKKDGRMAVNAYSHIRASLLGASVTVPLQEGGLVLGARQVIYLVELDGPQLRDLTVQILGE